jgi:hypothetical protein
MEYEKWSVMGWVGFREVYWKYVGLDGDMFWRLVN